MISEWTSINIRLQFELLPRRNTIEIDIGAVGAVQIFDSARTILGYDQSMLTRRPNSVWWFLILNIYANRVLIGTSNEIVPGSLPTSIFVLYRCPSISAPTNMSVPLTTDRWASISQPGPHSGARLRSSRIPALFPTITYTPHRSPRPRRSCSVRHHWPGTPRAAPDLRAHRNRRGGYSRGTDR